ETAGRALRRRGALRPRSDPPHLAVHGRAGAGAVRAGGRPARAGAPRRASAHDRGRGAAAADLPVPADPVGARHAVRRLAPNHAISRSYRAPVIADYLIPTYVVLALWIGTLAALPALVARWVAPSAVAAGLALLVGAGAVLVPVGYARASWASFDQSGDRADQ